MKLVLGVVGVVIIALAATLWFPGELGARLNPLDARELPSPSERARTLHNRLTIVDLHNDVLLWDRDPLVRGSWGHTDLPRLIEGRVALQVFSATTKVPSGQNFERNSAEAFDLITLLAALQRWPAATWTSLRARALHIADRLTSASRDSGGALEPVRTAAELASVIERFERGEQVVGGVLLAEGMHPLEGEVAGVDALYDAGYRILAPTHFFDNDIGGSAHGEEKGGLTPLGLRAIAHMQERRMLIDVAHASPATVSDVLEHAHGPILVSHVGVQATCPGPRNLSDAQIDAIAAGDGLIGIGFFAGAVCDISPDGIVRAMKHVADRVGVRHVALGSDWDGSTTVVVDPARLVHLTDALLRAGFSESDVVAVMGGNALRLLAAGLPAQ